LKPNPASGTGAKDRTRSSGPDNSDSVVTRIFESYGAVSQLVTLSKYFIASLSPAGFGD
jgi:hypothetical protein